MRVLFWYCDRFDWTPALNMYDKFCRFDDASFNRNYLPACYFF